LLSESYDLVVAKLPKKIRDSLSIAKAAPTKPSKRKSTRKKRTRSR
jgi:hypothetical protein